MTSNDFGAFSVGRNDLSDVYFSLQLTGFTVLDASGHVISNAQVTPQNVPGLNLFPAPEPSSILLLLVGGGGLLSLGLAKRAC